MEDKLFQICKSKIDKGFSFEEIVNFIESNGNEELFLKIKKDVQKYIAKKIEDNNRNKLYWMLICNSQKWYEETEEYMCNGLLYDLNENDIEPWKINGHTDMELQMKVGHRGIIKVSDDKRTEIERCNNEGELVEKLEAGIYGIFEVVEDEDGDCTYESEYGEYFVNIKVIDNYYAKGTNISKEISRKLLGPNVYNSIPSRKIDKKLYENIINHQPK